MEYRNLGRIGLRVSPLCLGTMNFGRRTSEPDAYAIMDRALESGINLIDTADAYGGRPGEGYSEQIIGRWLAQSGGRRERVVLATKVYRPMGSGPNEGGLSARHIRLACEASLRRLQTDHIDLYQMHHVDRRTPWEEIWEAMGRLIGEGKLIYVGSSNFAGWHIVQAQCSAKERYMPGVVSEQSLYNLADRLVELEVIPACQAFGLGVLVWSPLAGGILGGVLRNGAGVRRAEPEQQQRIEKHRQQLERYDALCQEVGERPAQVALAWLLGRPVVTSLVLGPRTQAQLDDSLRALEVRLSPEILARLDDIWPSPGGPAPEAYAWEEGQHSTRRQT